MNFAIFLAAVFSVCCFTKKSSAFLNGFPKERCDDMDPTKIKLPSDQKIPDDNSTDFGEDDRPPTDVRPSNSLNSYRIVSSETKYRRGRTLEFRIQGPDFNALIVQVRKIGTDERRGFDKIVRVGEFVAWPDSLRPLSCDKKEPTALTNKNYARKTTPLSFKWKAPKEEVGDIHVLGRFVSGDEFFDIRESRTIHMNEFPVNLNNCGKDRSCTLYSESTSSCHEDSCDYVLTYSVGNNSVEFVLGGNAKGDQSYLAIGFSSSPEADTMKIIACTRAKTLAEIKYFIFNDVGEGFMEYPMDLENKTLDLDGDRMWCRFTAPMVTHTEDGSGLDLSVPLYQIYLRGATNNTREMNIPILPSKLRVSKKEVPLDKIKLQYHTMEQPKEKSSAESMFSTISYIIHVPLLVLPYLLLREIRIL